MELYQIIKKAQLTEKSTIMRDAANQYCFEVHTDANRIEVERSVEKIFKVKVLSVRIMNVRGKKEKIGPGGRREKRMEEGDRNPSPWKPNRYRRGRINKRFREL